MGVGSGSGVLASASQGGGGRRPGFGRRPATTPRGAARAPRARQSIPRGLLVPRQPDAQCQILTTDPLGSGVFGGGS